MKCDRTVTEEDFFQCYVIYRELFELVCSTQDYQTRKESNWKSSADRLNGIETAGCKADKVLRRKSSFCRNNWSMLLAVFTEWESNRSRICWLPSKIEVKGKKGRLWSSQGTDESHKEGKHWIRTLCIATDDWVFSVFACGGAVGSQLGELGNFILVFWGQVERRDLDRSTPGRAWCLWSPRMLVGFSNKNSTTEFLESQCFERTSEKRPDLGFGAPIVSKFNEYFPT